MRGTDGMQTNFPVNSRRTGKFVVETGSRRTALPANHSFSVGYHGSLTKGVVVLRVPGGRRIEAVSAAVDHA
jgi:hypothetical protein